MILSHFINPKFVTSVVQPEQIEPATGHEVVFIGRSNVGKSSLLNALCNSNSLARVARQPGRTQAINFFEVAHRDRSGEKPVDYSCSLVDLPGYGYASVSKGMRRQWEKLMSSYFSQQERISLALLLIDSRRAPGEEESWIANQLRDQPIKVVLTKIDKLKQGELSKSKNRLKGLREFRELEVLTVSTDRKKANTVTNLFSRIVGEVF